MALPDATRVQLLVPEHALPQRTPTELLAMARRGLEEAAAIRPAGLRFAAAHVAALRAASAVVAAHAVPAPGVRRSRPTSVWTLVVQVAPELSDWCVMFAAGAAKRAAAEAGIPRVVTAAEADEGCARAADFVSVVEVLLGGAAGSPGDLDDSAGLPPALDALLDITRGRMSADERVVFDDAWTRAVEALRGVDLSGVASEYCGWRWLAVNLDASPAVVGEKLVELVRAAGGCEVTAPVLEFAPTLAERKAQWRADNSSLVAKLAAEGIAVCPDCVGRLHADGGCRYCEAERDPAWSAYLDAVNGAEHAGWEGRPYALADQKRDEETERRYELAQILGEWDSVTPANGCRFCGLLERGHARRHDGRHPIGSPLYAAPSDSLRLMRMRARRFVVDSRMYLAVAARVEALGGCA